MVIYIYIFSGGFKDFLFPLLLGEDFSDVTSIFFGWVGSTIRYTPTSRPHEKSWILDPVLVKIHETSGMNSQEVENPMMS